MEAVAAERLTDRPKRFKVQGAFFRHGSILGRNAALAGNWVFHCRLFQRVPPSLFLFELCIDQENISRMLIKLVTGLGVILLLTSGAYADDAPGEIAQRMGSGDPVAGRVKSLLCQACHGEDGNPATMDCPKLAGQYAIYIRKQIKDFQSGLRRDPAMTDIAARLTNEQDIIDIAAYFASRNKMKGAGSENNEAGRRRFEAGNGCQTCHGVNGKGLAPNNPTAPVIGGQNKNYLIKQLKDFRSNARTNESSGMMGMIADLMSDAQMEEVAGYESGL